MSEIFLSEYNAIFEDNGHAGWLYLLDEETDEIISDCWLYNRNDAPEIIDDSYRGSAPPAAKEFAGQNARIENPDEQSFSFLWSADRESGALLFVEYNLPRINFIKKTGSFCPSTVFVFFFISKISPNSTHTLSIHTILALLSFARVSLSIFVFFEIVAEQCQMFLPFVFEKTSRHASLKFKLLIPCPV